MIFATKEISSDGDNRTDFIVRNYFSSVLVTLSRRGTDETVSAFTLPGRRRSFYRPGELLECRAGGGAHEAVIARDHEGAGAELRRGAGVVPVRAEPVDRPSRLPGGAPDRRADPATTGRVHGGGAEDGGEGAGA